MEGNADFMQREEKKSGFLWKQENDAQDTQVVHKKNEIHPFCDRLVEKFLQCRLLLHNMYHRMDNVLSKVLHLLRLQHLLLT